MTTEPTTTPTLAHLEERVRAGDTSITAQQLAEAREADHLASLRQEAEERAHVAAQAEQHEAAVKQLRKDYAELQSTESAPARKAYADLVRASKKLNDVLVDFETKRRAVMDKAIELGVAVQCEDMFRIPAHTPEVYMKHAAGEATGKYWATGNGAAPHGLHSDEVIAKHEERQQRIREAQAEREAKFMENTETMVELGFGNYARRIEV